MEDSKLRKLIRETLEEELGKEQRYVATMEFYVWAQSDSEAIAQAKAQATEIDMKLDNRAAITGMVKQSQGTIGNSPVDINEESMMKKLKLKLKGVSDEQLAYNKKHGLPDSWKGSKEGFYEKMEPRKNYTGSNE